MEATEAIQALKDIWPAVKADMGTYAAVLGIGLLIGYVFKKLLVRSKIDEMAERINHKDDKLEWYKERVVDITRDYTSLKEKLSSLEKASGDLQAVVMDLTHRLNMSELMRTQLQSAVTMTSSVARNVSIVTGASGALGASIATLSLSPGGLSDYVATNEGYVPYYGQQTGATGPSVPSAAGPAAPHGLTTNRPIAPLRGPEPSERPAKK